MDEQFSFDTKGLLQREKKMEHPAISLCVLSTAGGLMGFYRKKSIVSLVAGVTVGGLYGISAYLLHLNRDGGLEIALGTSVLLLGAGIGRGIPVRFRSIVPSTLTLLGGIGTFYYYNKYKEFYP